MEFELRNFRFKPRSQDWYVAKALLEGKSREDVVKEFLPWAGKKEPYIFRENIGGGRRRKPQEDQYHLLMWAVNRTVGKMERAGWINPEPYTDKKKWSSKDGHWKRWRRNFLNELIEEGIIDDPEPQPKPLIGEPLPKPGSVSPVDPRTGLPIGGAGDNGNLTSQQVNDSFKALENSGKIEWLIDDERAFEMNDDGERVAEWNLDKENNNWIRSPKLEAEIVEEIIETPTHRTDQIDEFYKRMMLARDFVMSRELSGEYLDFVSTRAVRDGAKAIAHGISVDEVMVAVMKTWPEDSKNEFSRHERSWTPKAPTVDVDRYSQPLHGAHQYLGYVVTLAEARVPIFLAGPSGCGKSFMARDLAEVLDVDYGEIPLTAGATPSWLVGAETITGYKSRPFTDIYEEGGVFCFEEMDAADPNMLLLVNNALANESFTNPVTGQEIEKSHNFIPVATANTWGLGANRQFTGRERLDAATLDRWRVGRVEMDYDPKVEKLIIADAKRLAEKLETPVKARPKLKLKTKATPVKKKKVSRT